MHHHHRIAELYELHADAVRRFMYRRTGDHALSEDLCNDVFVHMIEGLPHYEERGLPIEAWMYRIARDRVIDTYRRQARRKQASLDGHDVAVCDVDECEIDDTLRSMLERLNPEQRQVLLMRYRGDMTFAQIAEVMQRSEGAVKQLRKRGLEQLKTHYQPVSSA